MQPPPIPSKKSNQPKKPKKLKQIPRKIRPKGKRIHKHTSQTSLINGGHCIHQLQTHEVEHPRKHNDRSVKPSYVLKSGGLGIECNRDAKEARALRDSLVEQAKINYKGILTNLLKQRLAVICGVLS